MYNIAFVFVHSLMLTTSADSSIKVWNVENKFSLHSVYQDTTHRWIWDAAFTYDAKLIVSGDKGFK